MNFISSSGLTGLTTDAREFLAAMRFARPGALWLLLLLPLLGLLDRWMTARRVRAVSAIGRPAAVTGQFTHPRPKRKWFGIAYPIAWLLLVLGVAGPQWGKSDEPGVAVGRDVVIVIDLSRTMLAEDALPPLKGWRVPDLDPLEEDVARAQRTGNKELVNATVGRLKEAEREKRKPERWRAARDGALDLVDAAAKRGGHRVAVVIFAARPKLLCPLTTDYDYVRALLEDLNGEHRPLEIRMADPDAPSGTRIGSALQAAVAAHDHELLPGDDGRKRYAGAQDIVLISDGDDPDASKEEWVNGANAARTARIPIHAAGVGNPNQVAVVEIKREPPLTPLQFRTILQEKPLKEIARATDDSTPDPNADRHYIPAQRGGPPLGKYFTDHIEPMSTREHIGDQVPQRKEQYVWFLAPALALFGVGWVRGR